MTDNVQENTQEEGSGWLDMLSMVALALIVAWLIHTFIAETYEVPSASMHNTILEHDRLVGEKVSLYWETPKAGDIVFFADPDGSGATLVKRVIATEGQTVDLVYGTVVVDGETLDEPYVEGRPTYPRDAHGSNLDENVSFPLTVSEGCIWVMGDNRENSLDSRYFGEVPVDSVKSRALLIYWPPSRIHVL